MKLLIVEDEPELGGSMAAYLRAYNFHCEIVSDLHTAISKIQAYDYDCILLDIILPDGNGLQLLEVLKSNNKTDGVIIISAKSAIVDKITGLQNGADDFLSKPFYLSELSARIGAVIRRRKFNGNEMFVLNDLKIDNAAKTVYVNGQAIYLTRKEYDLLLYMVVNKNRVLSKNALAAALSETVTSGDDTDVIYSHIKNLKRKLNSAGCSDYIRTIYGTGYKFEMKL